MKHGTIEKKIQSLLSEHGAMTPDEISAITGCSQMVVRSELKKMKKMGLVKNSVEWEWTGAVVE